MRHKPTSQVALEIREHNALLRSELAGADQPTIEMRHVWDEDVRAQTGGGKHFSKVPNLGLGGPAQGGHCTAKDGHGMRRTWFWRKPSS